MVLEYDLEHEKRVRAAAFAWLESQVSGDDRTVSWRVIRSGFDYQRNQVPLVSVQGIFKPRILGIPISIRTAPNGPYDDRMRDMVKE